MTPSPASPFRFPVRGRIAARAAATVTAAALVLGGCAVGQQTGQTEAASASSASSAAAATAGTVWDASSVHTIEVEIDPDVLAGLLATYEDSSAKDWASATVTIDGQTFENVGIKLKGNSSLQGVTAESDPTSLPWRIRLDKYVDGQSLDGYTDFAVRPNGSESSFNEAVALDLLADAGLATEKAVATAFSVNGDDAVLRLTVQNLDEAWVADEFPDAGEDSVLYKIESTASWSYLGDDADYSESFEVKAGPDDYAPLAELLDLLANGSEEELAERLPELVDLDSFATYLALEELMGNFDTIDGPGNNGYLFWDSATRMFTVVAWDHDRAFGVQLGGGGAGGAGGFPGGAPGGAADGTDGTDGAAGGPDGAAGGRPGGMEPPDGMQLPDGAELPDGVQPPEGFEPPTGVDGEAPGTGFGGTAPGGGMGGGSALATAMESSEEWSALIEEKKAELTTSLLDSGVLAASVEAWFAAVAPSGLVAEETLRSEADAIIAYEDGRGSSEASGMAGGGRQQDGQRPGDVPSSGGADGSGTGESAGTSDVTSSAVGDA